MQPEHLYLMFGILANLSKIFFIKLPASDEKEAQVRCTTFQRLSSKPAFYSRKVADTPAQKAPYLMRFEENFALFYQMMTFLLLKLAYGQILDLNEMLELAAVCLSF